MMSEQAWSKEEKMIAREAFEKAYKRECADLAAAIREKAENIKEPEDIWLLHDFLSEKSEELDEKYDYRYSVLIATLARLIKDGWIDFEDLNGLDEEKIEEIRNIIDVPDAGAEPDDEE